MKIQSAILARYAQQVKVTEPDIDLLFDIISSYIKEKNWIYKDSADQQVIATLEEQNELKVNSTMISDFLVEMSMKIGVSPDNFLNIQISDFVGKEKNEHISGENIASSSVASSSSSTIQEIINSDVIHRRAETGRLNKLVKVKPNETVTIQSGCVNINRCRDIPVQSYHCKDAIGTIFYLPGTASIANCAEATEAHASQMAEILACRVVVIHPRFVPENKHPIPYNDAVDVINQLIKHGHPVFTDDKGNPYNFKLKPKAIAGYSSGGLLATQIYLNSLQTGSSPFCQLLAVAPIIDINGLTDLDYEEGQQVYKEIFERFPSLYLPDGQSLQSQHHSPFYMNLSQLFLTHSSITFIVGGKDPLKPQITKFAQLLKEQNSQVDCEILDAFDHGLTWQTVEHLLKIKVKFQSKLTSFPERELQYFEPLSRLNKWGNYDEDISIGNIHDEINDENFYQDTGLSSAVGNASNPNVLFSDAPFQLTLPAAGQNLVFQKNSINQHISTFTQEAYSFINQMEISRKWELAQNFKQQASLVWGAIITPANLKNLDGLPFMAGYYPESETYQIAIDAIDVIQFWQSSKLNKTLSLINRLSGLGQLYNEGLERWKKAASQNMLKNCHQYLQEGYFDLVMKKTSGLLHPIAIRLYLQANLLKVLATGKIKAENEELISIYTHQGRALIEELFASISEIAEEFTDQSLAIWLNWQQAAYNLKQGKNISAINQLLGLILPGEPLTIPLLNHLIGASTVQGRFLLTEYLRYQLRELMETQQQNYQNVISKKIYSYTLTSQENVEFQTSKTWQDKVTEYTLCSSQNSAIDNKQMKGLGILPLLASPLYVAANIQSAAFQSVPPLLMSLGNYLYGSKSEWGYRYDIDYDEFLNEKFYTLKKTARRKSQLNFKELENTKRVAQDELKRIASSSTSINDYRNDIPVSSAYQQLHKLLSRLDEEWGNVKTSKSHIEGIRSLSKNLPCSDKYIEKLFFKCYQIFITQGFNKRQQYSLFLKAITGTLLPGIKVPEVYKYGFMLLSQLTQYRQPQKLSPESWLIMNLLQAPEYERRLSKHEVVHYLSIAVKNNDIIHGNVIDNLCQMGQQAYLLSPRDSFFYGIALQLLAINSINESFFYRLIDVAVLDFNTQLPVHLLVSQIIGRKSPELMEEFDKLWHLYQLDRHFLFVQCQLFLRIRRTDLLSVDNLRFCFRQTVYEHYCENSNYLFRTTWKKVEPEKNYIIFLLQKGLDPNKPFAYTLDIIDQAGFIWTSYKHVTIRTGTLLHRAVERLDLELFTTLLEYGADPKIKNAYGLDPLQWLLQIHGQGEQQTTLLKFIDVLFQSGYRILQPLGQFLEQRTLFPYEAELRKHLENQWADELKSYAQTRTTTRQRIQWDTNMTASLRESNMNYSNELIQKLSCLVVDYQATTSTNSISLER